jgi:hypothetical protein
MTSVSIAGTSSQRIKEDKNMCTALNVVNSDMRREQAKVKTRLFILK